MGSSTYNLADLLELVGRAVGDRPAITCGGTTVTFAEFWQRVLRAARLLEASGVRGGDRVGIQLVNSIEYLESFFATCRLGASPVNVNYRYQSGELAYLYRMMSVTTVVHGSAQSAAVEGAIASLGRPLVRIVLRAAGDAPAGAGCIDYVLPPQSASSDAAGAEARRSDDDAILLCTGGTTGMPKGVEWGARDLFFGALGGGAFFDAQRGPIGTPEDLLERVPALPPVAHFPLAPLMHGAALWAALISLFAGHRVVLSGATSFDAEDVWSIAEREGVNMMTIVGDAMALPLVMALEANPGRWKLERLGFIGSGGALFSEHLQQRLRAVLPRLQIGNSMGSSEAGALGTGGKPEGGGFIRIPARADLAVVVDRTRLAAPGEEGVLARTGSLPRGYYGDVEKTAETFVTLGGRRYCLTGDRARQQEDGSFVVFGRGSTCINTGGEKVFPEEVEEVLRSHPAVADALVIGIRDERWGERVTAVVALLPGAQLGAEELRRHGHLKLAGYKVPKDIAFVDAVRRTIAGKADYGWARATMTEFLGRA